MTRRVRILLADEDINPFPGPDPACGCASVPSAGLSPDEAGETLAGSAPQWCKP